VWLKGSNFIASYYGFDSVILSYFHIFDCEESNSWNVNYYY